jgi:flagellar hook-associated protein 2
MSTTAVSSSSPSTTSSTTSTNNASQATASTSANSTQGSTSFNAKAANQAAGQSIITALGTGSGVDTNALAQNLVNAEKIPQQNDINSKISKNDTTISGLSGVMYIMQSFQTSLNTLQDRTNFNAVAVSNSNSSALNITTDSSAIPGSHTVQVTSIAQAQTSISNGFASDTTPLASGQINLTLNSSNPGVSTGFSSTDTQLSGVSFGSTPSISDFNAFNITVGGITESVTPNPTSTNLSSLATNLQNLLNAKEGNSDIQVKVVNGALSFSSTSGRVISAVSLSPNANATGASAGTITLPTIASTASISNLSFGTNSSVNDFKTFTINVGGVTHTLTPAPSTATLSDLAANLQSQLQSLEGNTDLTVSANGTSLSFNSSSNRLISNVGLSTSSILTVGKPTGASLGGTQSGLLSGVSFGTPPKPTDFGTLTVTIGGVTQTITPTLSDTSMAGLASALTTQLNTAFGNATQSIIVTQSGVGGNALKISSTAGPVSYASLTTATTSPTGASGGTFSNGTISNISFGANPSTSDFQVFDMSIGGKPLTVYPSPAAANLNSLAADLQAQLNAKDKSLNNGSGSDIVVTTDGVGSITVTSKSGLAIVGPELTEFAATPAGLAQAINAKGAGVSAQVINNGSTDPNVPPYQLLLSGTIGAANSFSLTSNSLVNPGVTTGTASYIAGNGGTPSSATLTGVSFGNTPKTTDFKSLTVTVNGTTNTLNLSPSTATPADLVANIQSQLNQLYPGPGLTAAMSNGSLSITANGTQQITAISLSPNSTFSLSNITNASNANLVVDGVSYTRTSNSINDIVSGMTIGVNTTTSTAATVNLTRDTSTLVTNINSMVTAYNDAMNVLNAVSDPKSTLATYGGSLVGNSTVMMLKQKLSSMMLGNSSTPGSSIGALWQLGITIDASGVMSANSTTLTSTLNNNFNDVVKMFTGNQDNSLGLNPNSPSGLAGDAVKQLTSLLSATGPITTQSNDLTTQNQTFQNDLSALQTRMDALLVRYQTEFAAMNSFVGSTNAQKTSLKASFDGMMAMYTNK